MVTTIKYVKEDIPEDYLTIIVLKWAGQRVAWLEVGYLSRCMDISLSRRRHQIVVIVPFILWILVYHTHIPMHYLNDLRDWESSEQKS